MLNKRIDCKSTTTVFVKDKPIRMFVNELFSSEELEVLYPTLSFTIQYSYDEFKTNYNSLRDEKNYHYVRYMYLLATFQRIRLPLEYLASKNIPLKHYTQYLDELENFKLLDSLIEKYFDAYYPLSKNEQFYISRKEMVTRFVLKFWLAGYGLIEGYGHEPISLEAIEEFLKAKKRRDHDVKIIRFLTFMLMHEQRSLIKEEFKTQFNRGSIVKNQEILWNNLLSENDSEITRELENYVLNINYQRLEKNYILRTTDLDGRLQTVTYKQITIATWEKLSYDCRLLAKELFELGFFSLTEEVISIKIPEIVAAKRTNTFKTHIKQWLDFYIKTKNLKFNVNKILPVSRGNKEKRYGKVLNYAAAVELLETLIDDESPYLNENNLMDFRCRRALLLQLECGARFHEISLLKKECLKVNNNGDTFIHFHKTKNGKSKTIKLKPEGINYVKQLQTVAPINKISLSKTMYEWGDDLTEFRLLSGVYGPYIPLTGGSVNGWLERLQQKIWRETVPDGGYFKTHDFRRMCATYMKIRGYSNEEIAERLGQTSLLSQLTYTQSFSPNQINILNKAAKEDLWIDNEAINNFGIKNESKDTDFSIDKFLNRTNELQGNTNDNDLAKQVVERLSDIVDSLDLPTDSYVPESDFSGGFPMVTNSCTANIQVTCKHTEIKCFGCNYYKPESNKLIQHKAEVFRWIILINHFEKEKKKYKNQMQQKKVSVNINQIKENLEETFKNLFYKFNLEKKEARFIEEELLNNAKKYLRKYGNKKPTLTYKEALDYLNKGVI